MKKKFLSIGALSLLLTASSVTSCSSEMEGEPPLQQEHTEANTKSLILYEIIKNIIVDAIVCDRKDVKMEASFIDDLGASSLDMVDLFMQIEEEFSIEIPDADAEKITHVINLYDYVSKRVGESIGGIIP